MSSSPCYRLPRLLSGVTFVGTQTLLGLLVGGARWLSGMAAKLSRIPPRGPCSWKMPP